MGFLHGWALMLGAGAVALPVVVHFLTRPRPVTLPLSTIKFVHEAVRQRRARHRLRDFLVLLLRTLAVILIAWAFARPLLGQFTSLLAEDSASQVRVVVLDVSQSMGAMSRGVQVLERARTIASQFLSDAGETKVNLVLAGAAPRAVFDQPTGNVAALRDELTRVRVHPERLNLQAALNIAAQQFAKSAGTGEKEVQFELVVVSDFQRTNWTAVDFKPLPEKVRIKLESVAPAEALANVAITRVGAAGRHEQGRESRVEVEVANYSPSPRQVHVEVSLGTTAQRLQGLCPSYGKATLTAETTLRTPGWHSGAARLLDVQDALAADNTRPVVLDVRPPPSFALVTRQPAAVRGSSYYLERGLFPNAEATAKDPRLRRFDAGQLDRENIAAADVVLLDHPGKLSPEAIQHLAGALRRGKGVFYVITEQADATNLRLLGDVLKTDLQLPVSFVPPGPNERRRGLFLTDVKRDRPPFSIFGDGLPAMVEPLRFAGGLPSRRTEQGLSDDVMATYNDGTAALVVTSSGAGQIALFNGDLAASNITASSAFVPVLGELMDRLLGQQQLAEAQCGEPQAVYLPTSAGTTAGLYATGPAGSGEELGQFREESNGVLWSTPRLGLPGIYRVLRDNKPVYELACVISSDECDLRPIDPELLKGRLAGGRTIAYHDASRPDDGWEDFWVWLTLAAALCLVSELLVLKLFRS